MQQRQESPDARSLFALLLREFPNLRVVETENSYQLTFPDEQSALAAKSRLETILSSAAEFSAAVHYQIQSTGSSTLRANPVEPPKNTVEALRQILVNLFGQEIFDDASFNLNLLFDPKEAKIKDGVLFSKPARARGIEKAWGELLKTLMLHFHGASLDQIRQAWLGQGSLPRPDDSIDLQAQSASGIIEECFLIEKVEGKRVVVFNAMRLWQFLFPPVVTLSTSEAHSLEVSKPHFLNNLRAKNNNDVLFHVFKDEQNGIAARPIILGRSQRKSFERNALYTLLIDRSGSMEPYFGDLKKQIIQFTEKLRLKDPEAIVRIVFFSQTYGPAKEFNINQKDSIEQFIYETPIESSTYLFDAIRQELQYTTLRQKTDNVVLLLFTDGRDSSPGPSNKIAFTDFLKKSVKASVARPRVNGFCFGDCDAETVGLVASSTGGELTILKGIDQFNAVLDQAHRLHQDRRIIRFVVNSASGTQHIDVPVYQDDSIQKTDFILPLQSGTNDLTIDGVHVKLTLSEPHKLPLINELDRLDHIMAQLRDSLSDEKNTLVLLENKIRNAEIDISKLQYHSSQFNYARDHALKEIHQYRDLLRDAKTDARQLELVRNIAQTRRNFIVVENEPTMQFHMPVDQDHPQVMYANGIEMFLPHRPAPFPGIEIVYDHLSGPSLQRNSLAYRFFAGLHRGVQQLLPAPSSLTLKSTAENLPIPYTPLDNTFDQVKLFGLNLSFLSASILRTSPSPEGIPIFDVLISFSSSEGAKSSVFRFYGQPLPCRSADGMRHNLLEVIGELKGIEQHVQLSKIADVCTHLPPTRLQLFGNSVLSGVELGVAQGIATIATKGRKEWQPYVMAMNYFILDLAIELLRSACSDTEMNLQSIIMKPAMLAGLMLVMQLLLSSMARGSQNIGVQLYASGYKKTGQLVAGTGHFCSQYGLTVYNAVRQPAFTAVNIAASVVTRKAIESTGKTLTQKIEPHPHLLTITMPK